MAAKAGATTATFRDKLRGAIRGSEKVPAWAFDFWFMRHVSPVILDNEDVDLDLVMALAESQNGRDAVAIIQRYLATPEKPEQA